MMIYEFICCFSFCWVRQMQAFFANLWIFAFTRDKNIQKGTVCNARHLTSEIDSNWCGEFRFCRCWVSVMWRTCSWTSACAKCCKSRTATWQDRFAAGRLQLPLTSLAVLVLCPCLLSQLAPCSCEKVWWFNFCLYLPCTANTIGHESVRSK